MKSENHLHTVYIVTGRELKKNLLFRFQFNCNKKKKIPFVFFVCIHYFDCIIFCKSFVLVTMCIVGRHHFRLNVQWLLCSFFLQISCYFKQKKRKEMRTHPAEGGFIYVCVFCIYSWNSIWCCTSGNLNPRAQWESPSNWLFYSEYFFFLSVLLKCFFFGTTTTMMTRTQITNSK